MKLKISIVRRSKFHGGIWSRICLPGLLAMGLVVGFPGAGAALEAVGSGGDHPLAEVVRHHPRVEAAQRDLLATGADVRSARSGYFPTLSGTAYYGREKVKRPSLSDTDMEPKSANLTVTQLLWDFGATSAKVDVNLARQTRARFAVEEVQQGILLEAVSACLSTRRANTVLGHARKSENNIKKQARLEDVRVRQGAGVTTDVIQAKAQLAGALARRVQALGQLREAQNRMRAVYGQPAETVLPKVVIPSVNARLPAGLEQAVAEALENSPTVRLAAMDMAIARTTVRRLQRSGYAPTLNLVGDLLHKEDDDGTQGKRDESLIKVELSHSFSTGLGAYHDVRAARESLLAAEERLHDSRRLVEESVRNAWNQLQTARANHAHLVDQARLAEAFLKLARKERELGTRTLLDVLNGETGLINARSDAAAAATDIRLAGYRLLHAVGRLNLDVVLGSPATKAMSSSKK